MNALSSIKSVLISLSASKSDNEAEEVVINRYVPESVESMCRQTHYTPREVRMIYRAFKQECPTGIVYEQQFKELYSQYFPLGDARPFSGLLFSNIDHNRNGWITFEQFICSMSLLTRGTLSEKLRWVFNLYDLNGDGFISRDELTNVVVAVHALLGTHTLPTLLDNTARNHVQRIFKKMDLDNDGRIGVEDFTEACLADPKIKASMCGLFDSTML
ncbi:putative Kv channel-interacting protein 4 [Hypsibius exemplaris]|uniref:Kv channel-interacting protein 4 n=1 Tax=Hypsibius exemplaris TaxID=2072580 RepID=A0A1W0X022_HYPEX|nr:putative Kv channel-interacting protein 4 [Hypsibius exemplaris]